VIDAVHLCRSREERENREDTMTVPLAPSTPAALGLDPQPLERLGEIITGHLAEGRYPGAQIAVARRGQLALFRTFGDARLDPARAAAREDTLWLMYSNTKVITACAVWILAERGALRYTDRVADHVPGFEAHGKGDITIIQLLSHQAGFPNADVPVAAWTDHDLLRRTVCDYTLEWTPGSRVVYHGRAAHWTAAVMIEALTKTDYRAFIRENITEPLGLGRELYVGLPDGEHARAVDMHEPGSAAAGQVKRPDENTPEFRRAGAPGGWEPRAYWRSARCFARGGLSPSQNRACRTPTHPGVGSSITLVEATSDNPAPGSCRLGNDRL
jgi:CubicO group peptidase (beta-lactamase class C family)